MNKPPVIMFRGDRVRVVSQHGPGEKNGQGLPPLDVPYAVITRGGGGPAAVPQDEVDWGDNRRPKSGKVKLAPPRA